MLWATRYVGMFIIVRWMQVPCCQIGIWIWNTELWLYISMNVVLQVRQLKWLECTARTATLYHYPQFFTGIFSVICSIYGKINISMCPIFHLFASTFASSTLSTDRRLSYRRFPDHTYPDLNNNPDYKQLSRLLHRDVKFPNHWILLLPIYLLCTGRGKCSSGNLTSLWTGRGMCVYLFVRGGTCLSLCYGRY